jgi:hypothetical protein
MPVSQERLRRALAIEVYARLSSFFDAHVEEPVVASAADDRHKVTLTLAARRPKNVSSAVVSSTSPDMSDEEADTVKARQLAERSNLRQALATEVDMLLNNLFDADVDEPIVVSAADDQHELVLELLRCQPNNVSLSLVSGMSAEISPDITHMSPDMSGVSADMSGRQTPDTPDTPDILSPMQRDILEALSSDAMKAKELAERAGYRLNSYFRTSLSRLVNRGYLQCTRKGYVHISNHLRENVRSA